MSHSFLIVAVYNNMEAFWRDDLTSLGIASNDSTTQGRYKSGSGNVSYEDLLEFSEERQQVKRVQHIVGKEVSLSVLMLIINN